MKIVVILTIQLEHEKLDASDEILPIFFLLKNYVGLVFLYDKVHNEDRIPKC